MKITLRSSGFGLALTASTVLNYSTSFADDISMEVRARCSVPAFDGTILTIEWKDVLWARFFTGAPQRQRQSVERYKIVKRA